ncbi:exonuclease 1 [Tanacetum coccineum]
MFAEITTITCDIITKSVLMGIDKLFAEIKYVLVKTETLKRDNVSYIVAPYEADAQLAYLCLKGHADAILTPDSDLIAYGCKKVEGSKAFTGFTQDMVLQTCILGGCDYVSIRGVSIKEAINAMRDHNGVMNEEDDYFKVIEKASVYNPDDKTIVHLTHMPFEREDDYLYGSPIAQEFAEGIATEDLDPGTRMKGGVELSQKPNSQRAKKKKKNHVGK